MVENHSLTHQMPQADCAVPWSEMEGDDRVRTCPLCKEKVYNPALLNAAELQQLSEQTIQSAGNPVQLYRRRDGKIMLTKGSCLRTHRLRIHIALVAEVLIACGPLYPGELSVWNYTFPLGMVTMFCIKGVLEFHLPVLRATFIGFAVSTALAALLYLLPLVLVKPVYCALVALLIAFQVWFHAKYGIAHDLRERRYFDQAAPKQIEQSKE